jgi:hypothetical protein
MAVAFGQPRCEFLRSAVLNGHVLNQQTDQPLTDIGFRILAPIPPLVTAEAATTRFLAEHPEASDLPAD